MGGNYDVCSVACGEALMKLGGYYMGPGQSLDHARRLDGTYRLMLMTPDRHLTTKAEVEHYGNMLRPAGVSCPTCGKLLPSEEGGGGDIYYTDSVPSRPSSPLD